MLIQLLITQFPQNKESINFCFVQIILFIFNYLRS